MSTAYIYIALKRDVILLIISWLTKKDKKEKRQLPDFVQLTLLFLWTSLGLNQGPPDYENDKMIFRDSSIC